jgi:hypothetical protein
MITVPFPEPHRYLAELDEETFYEWLLRIPVVASIADLDKITLKTSEIDDASAQEFAAIVARYDLNARLTESLRKGRVVSAEKKPAPESVVVVEKPANGFSLSFHPKFVSPLDERGFDDWLKRSYPRYAGLDENKAAVLELMSNEVDIPNVHELIGLCRRYSLNMSRMRRLCDVADADHFRDDKKYWHEAIYGTREAS